ncbi:hypothetical protein BER30_001648 [Clostridioides difficile]|nr:hypothetical protein [Clostridioides difficile]OMK38038.1 hypothetical protein BER30_001648 [Clostridioides difficile]
MENKSNKKELKKVTAKTLIEKGKKARFSDTCRDNGSFFGD